MAYNTQDLLTKAEIVIKEKNLFFIEDVAIYLGIAKQTFYEHFPNESDDYKSIVGWLSENKSRTKNSMRNKWFKSDNPTLQVALMKLISSDAERRKLSQSYLDVESKGEKLTAVTVEIVNAKKDTSD
jgi:AcrR family transcriptional regulator